MKKYREVLEKYHIKPISYVKRGKSLIIETKENKFAIKENIKNPDIYDYLNSRSFDYYPKVLNQRSDPFELSEFKSELNIPEEQKLEEMLKITALLHSKTTYYQKNDLADNKEIYETLTNNILYLKSYYEDIIALIDSKEFFSPAEYLVSRNFSKIMDSLAYAENALENWYKSIEKNTSERVAVIHNNLDLDHFIYNKDSYLISWRKSKIAKPIFDLVKIFNRYGIKYDFKEKLAIYEAIYPLKDDEKQLFYILISMPPKIEFKDNNYELCKELSEKIELLYLKDKIILPENFENGEDNN